MGTEDDQIMANSLMDEILKTGAGYTGIKMAKLPHGWNDHKEQQYPKLTFLVALKKADWV